jgi:hypothetical protein
MKTSPDLLQKLIAKLRTDIDLPNAKLSAGYYYTSLPLAVTDAVFSVGVKYNTVVNAVHHLARRVGWNVYRLHGSPHLDRREQHTISELLAEYSTVFDPTEIFGNRSYANPAAAIPIPKAILVQRMAEVLAANGIETFNDFIAYPNPQALDETLLSLPSMSSGVVVFYLRMLSGNDENIKPDRHIHSFIRIASGNSNLVLSNDEAINLMREAARYLAVTPRLLDHAVWSMQRLVRGIRTNKKASTEENHPSTQNLFTRGFNHIDQATCSTGFQGSLKMDQFWQICLSGGTTPSGLVFYIDEQERLHIISPRSKNKNYKISRSTIEGYMEKLEDVHFRRDHGWFCNVADFALQKLFLLM